MISWSFALISLFAIMLAAFVHNMRRAVLALWVAGLAIGGLYLTLGAELLAVIQWIVATVTAISFVFFSAMFGEYGGKAERQNLKAVALTVAPVFLGFAFAGLVWLGAGSPGAAIPPPPSEGNDLASIGQELVGSHLLSLEVLALTLFLVLVGGGIIARPEIRRSSESGGSGEGDASC